MKEAFCCVCGKTGAWPLCRECRECREKQGLEGNTKKIKKLRTTPQHHPDYFEAILQNRVTGGPSEEKIWEIIYDQQDKRNFGVWEKKDDFYFTDLKAAKVVAKTLAKKFKLNLIETRKHVGFDRMKSRKIFKWTICLRNSD